MKQTTAEYQSVLQQGCESANKGPAKSYGLSKEIRMMRKGALQRLRLVATGPTCTVTCQGTCAKQCPSPRLTGLMCVQSASLHHLRLALCSAYVLGVASPLNKHHKNQNAVPLLDWGGRSQRCRSRRQLALHAHTVVLGGNMIHERNFKLMPKGIRAEHVDWP